MFIGLGFGGGPILVGFGAGFATISAGFGVAAPVAAAGATFRKPANGPDTFVMRLDGSDLRRVTNTPGRGR